MKLIPTIFLVVVALALLVAMNFDRDLLDEENASGPNPIEIGTVKWIRDLDEGITKAKTTNRDVFLLFQEVPG